MNYGGLRNNILGFFFIQKAGNHPDRKISFSLGLGKPH